MTNNDYREEGDYQTRYEACHPLALAEFKRSIEPIKQSFEHKLNDEAICDADYSTFKLFVNAVEHMFKRSCYNYIDEYNDFEYDFGGELKAMLLDEYGWKV